MLPDALEGFVVHHHGVRPDHTPKSRDYTIDLILLAKGGQARALTIDRDGNWVEGDDLLNE